MKNTANGRRTKRRGVSAMIFIAAAACVAPPPAPEAERLVGEATGVAEPVVFLSADAATDAASIDSGQLTLKDAIRRAVLSNPRLQSLLARVRVALADAEQARLLPNPILEIAYRIPRIDDAPDEIDIGVSAELIPLLTRPGRSRAADDRLRASVADAVQQALDVVVSVRASYAAVQAFDELIPALEERRDLLTRLVTVSQERLDSGEGTRLDVTSLRTQQAELGLDLLELAREKQDARLELAHLVGQPSDPAAWAVEPRAALVPYSARAEERWVEAALARRPDIEALRWEVEALKEDAQRAGVTILEGSGVGLSAEKAEDWSIGPALAVPIPLFDFGSARRARAEAVLLEAQHRLTEAKRVAVTEVRRAYASSAALQRSVASLKDVALPLQRQRREEIEAIYLGGQADITTLIIAEQDLRLAQVRLVELEQRAATAHAELERAVGGPTAAAAVEAQSSASETGDIP